MKGKYGYKTHITMIQEGIMTWTIISTSHIEKFNEKDNLMYYTKIISKKSQIMIYEFFWNNQDNEYPLKLIFIYNSFHQIQI